MPHKDGLLEAESPHEPAGERKSRDAASSNRPGRSNAGLLKGLKYYVKRLLRLLVFAVSPIKLFAHLVLRCVFLIIDPVVFGRLAGRAVRGMGVFETPTLAQIVANYINGLVLFGRSDDYGARFAWHSFPARAIITRDTANVPKRLRSFQRRGELEVRYDEDFDAIIRLCRQGRSGWLTPGLTSLYLELQKLGFVASVGTYRDGQLVGGLWGLRVGRVFGIMSMFHRENHAGALALAALVESLGDGGRWSVIDCGTMNPNWERYGAKAIPVRASVSSS